MTTHFATISISIVFILYICPVYSTLHQTAHSESLVNDSYIDSQKSALYTNNHQKSDNSSRRHLVIVTLETPPFMMKRNATGLNNDTVEWYGYCMDFFNEVIKHLPYELSYEIYQVSDNKFGSKQKRVYVDKGAHPVRRVVETWNGLVGDLVEGKAHLALSPLAVMAERELAIDFTVPFYDLVGIQILLKKPEVPQDWFKFLTVLDNEVWFSITLAYFVTSFVIFLFDRLSPYSHKNLARIEKLKQDRKKARDVSVTGMDKQSIGTNFDYRLNSSLSPNYNPGNQMRLNAPLSRSLRSASTRKLSTTTSFLTRLFSPKRKDSVFPNDDIQSPETNGNLYQRGRRLSTDYFRSINPKKSIAIWDEDYESTEVDDGKPDFGIRDSLWFCITSLTPQGGGEAPQNLSGRVVAGAWWLFCFIVIASYTANLAAFLTVSRLDIPIESLDDLAKQYRIKYAPVDGTAEQTYFERMAYIEEIFYNIWKQMSLNDSLSEEERSKFAVWDYPISDKYTKIWAQIQQAGLPQGIELGVNRVKSSTLDDGFALIADANIVKHAVMTDCSFKAVGDEFSRKPIALGVAKGESQLRDDISYAILQLINQRFMEVLREKWWTNNPRRVICDTNNESEGISIENIGGVFIIIFAGVILSFVVWAIERFMYSTKINVSKELISKL